MSSGWVFCSGQTTGRTRCVFTIVLVSAVLLFSGCAPVGEALPLSDQHYLHPSGIFTIPIPQGWDVSIGEAEQVMTLTPVASGPDVKVIMIAEVLPGQSEEAMSEAAQVLLEKYMLTYLPYEDYEIYNQAELRVDRNPALILDIARPLDDTYHVGRLVMVYLPGHLVFLAGFGERSAWDLFLPTFRKMVEGISFNIQPFPLET